jgi:hypothetical protein
MKEIKIYTKEICCCFECPACNKSMHRKDWYEAVCMVDNHIIKNHSIVDNECN